jgi:uncharacterized protein YyaL (SSP411 family)
MIHLLKDIRFRSGDYKDELVWGAVWLYRATNDNKYLNTAEQLYNEFGLQYWNVPFTWDAKSSAVEVRDICIEFNNPSLSQTHHALVHPPTL